MNTKQVGLRVAFALSFVIAAGRPVWPATAAVDGTVVGDGTPASCTAAALNAALSSGGTITFSCGGPKTIQASVPPNITQPTKIDGGGLITITMFPLFGLRGYPLRTQPGASTPLELQNISLDGGISAYGPLTMTNVVVTNNSGGVSSCGGAVIVAADALITGSVFLGNTAQLGGGAICTRSPATSTVRIVNSRFLGNRATDTLTGHGGAIYVDGRSQVTVIDSEFVTNTAHLGGAIYVSTTAGLVMQGSPEASITSSRLQLNANVASQDGGAIYIDDGGIAMIDRAVLSSNRTPTNTVNFGGAIMSGGQLTLSNSVVSYNVSRYGGGIYAGNGGAARALINRTKFLSNTSEISGGGLYASTGATTIVTISNSSFSGNTSGNGGGLARFNATMTVVDSSFTFNTADRGGGLSLAAGPSPSSGPYIKLRNVTVSNNTATNVQGGGVYNTGLVELYHMTIVSNTNGVFSAAGANTRFRDVVLQNPNSLNCNSDGTASISDDGANFSADTSCVLPNSNSHTGANLNAQLGVLEFDTGSNTNFHMPLTGSPLINAGFDCPPLDQRGASRIGACDIGAIEYGGIVGSRLSLPLVFREWSYYFLGPSEKEPNNLRAEANGPLLSGVNYLGNPNDANDYFSFIVPKAGPVAITLSGHAGEAVNGLQLQLRDANDQQITFVFAAPFVINVPNLAPGTYYARIFYAPPGPYNSSTQYTLRVDYPGQ